MSEQNQSQGATQSRCFCCVASDRMGNFFREMGPSEQARDHFRQARIEFLKGIRRVIDDRIDHLGRTETRGTRVTVD